MISQEKGCTESDHERDCKNRLLQHSQLYSSPLTDNWVFHEFYVTRPAWHLLRYAEPDLYIASVSDVKRRRPNADKTLISLVTSSLIISLPIF